MQTFFLAVVGVIFAGLGAMNLVFPAQGIAPFGLELTTAPAFNEMRANYGGMHLFLGLYFLTAALRPTLHRPALITIAVFTGGLTFGRFYSLLIDGAPTPFIWTLLAVEAAGCALAIVLRLRARNISAQNP